MLGSRVSEDACVNLYRPWLVAVVWYRVELTDEVDPVNGWEIAGFEPPTPGV